MLDNEIREQIAEPIHAAVCYDSWEECRDEGGRCIRAAERQLERGVRAPAQRVGYITGYRNADGDWQVPFDGTPFATREEAIADAADASTELSGVDWRALTVYDETGEPYRAGEHS